MYQKNPNPIQKALQEADALDVRRQEQIANQVKTINRLLVRLDAAEELLKSQGLWEDYQNALTLAGVQPQESDQT